MSDDKIAIAFSNCLGNFLIMTAALKILRTRGHKHIDLITDEQCLKKHPSVGELAEELFDNIVYEYHPKDYDQVFISAWSRPLEIFDKEGPVSVWWSGESVYSGIHEVQVYLDMIQSSWREFEGFSMPIVESPKLNFKAPIIALANSSPERGSRRGNKTGWNKFPELSESLIELGYTVVLLGQGDELKDCEGHNFIDQLSIMETAKAISQCDLMITVDTGLMHVADALGVPIILLAGPTLMTKSHPIISPYKVVRKFISCAPCFQKTLWKMCDDPQCMDLIQVEDVLRKVFDMGLLVNINSVNLSDNYVNSVQDDLKLIGSNYRQNSIFERDFKNIDEIIYNPSHDMLGDLMGSVFILQWLQQQYPELKISWYNAEKNSRQGTNWFNEFNILDWIPLEIYQFYNELPKDKVVISSCGDFYVWSDLKFIELIHNWHPKMNKKESYDGLPEQYVAMHILQPTKHGDRSGAYVKRRALDFGKYESLAKRLESEGVRVVRVGADYDKIREIDGITDLAGQLTMDETFRVIANASVFLSGDSGLKLASSAFGIPTLVELDNKSTSMGALSGCNPEITYVYPLGVQEYILYNQVMHLMRKEK